MNPIKYIWAIRALVYKLFMKIGSFSYLGKPLLIIGRKQIDISKRVRILPGLRAEVHGPEGLLKIGEDVSIGQNFHVTAGGLLEIKSGVCISGNVCITSIDHQYEEIDKPILEQPHINSNTIIGEGCFIGYGVVIQAGTELGRQCVVGANSVVRGVYPDYCVLVGGPAKVVKKFDTDQKKWVKV